MCFPPCFMIALAGLLVLRISAYKWFVLQEKTCFFFSQYFMTIGFKIFEHLMQQQENFIILFDARDGRVHLKNP